MSVKTAHQQAYAFALSEDSASEPVEQAFGATESWKEALSILGFVPEDWEGEIQVDGL